jgi:hypothetical protein
MISTEGGLAAARSLLHAAKISDESAALWERGRHPRRPHRPGQTGDGAGVPLVERHASVDEPAFPLSCRLNGPPQHQHAYRRKGGGTSAARARRVSTLARST